MLEDEDATEDNVHKIIIIQNRTCTIWFI